MWFGVDTPFGGYKQSGLGREHGVDGLRGVPRDQDARSAGELRVDVSSCGDAVTPAFTGKPREEAAQRVLPLVDDTSRVLLGGGPRRRAALPAAATRAARSCTRPGRCAGTAGPRTSRTRDVAPTGVVVGVTVNHQQWDAALRAAVRDRDGRDRRGPARPRDHEPRRPRARRRARRACACARASSSTRTSGSRSSRRPASPTRPLPADETPPERAPPRTCARRCPARARGPRGDHRDRHVARSAGD